MGGVESTEVTAGIWGFLVFFGLALACWFLFRSMNGHLRRMRYAEREQMSAMQSVDDPIGAPEHHSNRRD